MSNKNNFIKNCILLLDETDIITQQTLIKEAVRAFTNSKMIDYTPESFKTDSIKEISNILNDFIENKNVSKNDVKQMYILQSELIAD
jgi:hypothetical protein